MAVGVFEIDAAAAVVAADLAGAFSVRIGPVLESSLADAGEDLVVLFFANKEGVMLGGNLAVVIVESMDTSLLSGTTSIGPNGVAFGRPKTSVKKVADFSLSRHQMIVWFNCTLILELSFPGRRRIRSLSVGQRRRVEVTISVSSHVVNRFLTAVVKYKAALGMAAVVFQKRSLPRAVARS